MPNSRQLPRRLQDLPVRNKKRPGIGEGSGRSQDDTSDRQQTLDVTIDEFSRAIMAKIVNKCGRRVYWEDWAQDVAEIAEKHITRITSLGRSNRAATPSNFFQRFPDRTARRPERRGIRAGSHRNAGPTPDYPASVRRTVQGP